MPSQSAYFKPLTGLRFIAALMVFVTHLVPKNFNDFINNLIVEFHVGVPIFFVLSGFLIGYRYFNLSGPINGGLFSYAVNRFVRIVPLYLLVTIANIMWYGLDSRTAFLNLTLLHGFYSDVVFTPLPHTWSLTVECTFYFLVPLIFFMMRKKLDVLLQGVLFLVIGWALTYFLHSKFGIEGWGDYKFMLLLTFFGRCFEFLLGIRLALYVRSKKTILSHLPQYTYSSVAVFALIMVILSLIGGLNTYTGILLHNLILPVCLVWMIFGLIASKNIISGILSSPLFQLLGNSSYAFFLIHYGFWQRFMMNYVTVNFWLQLAASIILSILIYKLIEEPLIRIAKRKLKKYTSRKGSLKTLLTTSN